MEQQKLPSYKFCIVPWCKNTIRSAPDKVFFLVPYGEIRKQWCKVIKRDMVSPRTCLYCCEDHFNIEEDTQNYIQYKIMCLQEKHKMTLRLKKGILPHKFLCQKTEEPKPETKPETKAFKKRRHLETLQEALSPCMSGQPTLRPLASKPACCEQDVTSDMYRERNDDTQNAAAADNEQQILINTCNPETQASDVHLINKDLPIHLVIKCNACQSDIIGFRYTCLQCVDWDMCAECEARGEHPEHFVLRLPAPKLKAESEPVLAAIRKHIEDLLKLNYEMHDALIKQEPDEVKSEMDIDEMEFEQTPELEDRSVPEMNIDQENCTNSANYPPPILLEERTRPTSPDEQHEVSDSVETLLFIKKEANVDPLFIDQSLLEIHEKENQIKREPH